MAFFIILHFIIADSHAAERGSNQHCFGDERDLAFVDLALVAYAILLSVSAPLISLFMVIMLDRIIQFEVCACEHTYFYSSQNMPCTYCISFHAYIKTSLWTWTVKEARQRLSVVPSGKTAAHLFVVIT